ACAPDRTDPARSRCALAGVGPDCRRSRDSGADRVLRRHARDRVLRVRRSPRAAGARRGRPAACARGRDAGAEVAPGAGRHVPEHDRGVGAGGDRARPVAHARGAPRRRLRRPRDRRAADPAVDRPGASGRSASAGRVSAVAGHYDPDVQNWVLSELDSGERVISERLEHVRSAAVGYWIGAGSRDEDGDEAGVTHFIEHLLFKGTERYSALEIAEIFDGLGGELNAATAREHTLVYARIPDHHLETAVEVMSDMVFAPAFVDLD